MSPEGMLGLPSPWPIAKIRKRATKRTPKASRPRRAGGTFRVPPPPVLEPLPAFAGLPLVGFLAATNAAAYPVGPKASLREASGGGGHGGLGVCKPRGQPQHGAEASLGGVGHARRDRLLTPLIDRLRDLLPQHLDLLGVELDTRHGEPAAA